MKSPAEQPVTRSPVALTHISRREEEDELLARPLQIRTFKRLFAYTNQFATKRNILICLAIIRSIQLPLLAWIIGAVISGPIDRGDVRGVVLGALGFAALAIFTQIVMYYRMRLALELGQDVVHSLRNDVFEHLQRMTTSFYNQTKIGRVISRMTSDIESVRIGVQDIVFVTLVQGGQMIGAGLLMLWQDWVLFSVLMVMAPVIWFLNRRFKTKLMQAQRSAQESFSRVTATLAESVGGIRVTQGFVRQDVNAGFFRDLVTDHSKYNLGAARTTAVFLPLLELNSQFFIAVLVVLGGYRVLNPAIALPIGDVVQFLFLSNLFFEPIRVIGNQYTQAMMAVVGAERVFHLLDAEPDWEDPSDAQPLQIRGRVEFRETVFGYDPSIPVLEGISFVAEPGQVVALVGHTGGGKTSIINLISKAYLPTGGEVLIDGVDIRRIATESLHRQLGIVQQQSFLFQRSVMENIRYSRPGASDEEVIAAVRELDFLDLVEGLPGGFATQVGEGGSGLSMGQRQLICFARAFLADPKLLLLDEATSSIDSMTEARIQRSLERLMRGRTSFVIAHRLSTIRTADLILVMDHGRIAERGTHSELIERKGIYAALHDQFVQTGSSAHGN